MWQAHNATFLIVIHCQTIWETTWVPGRSFEGFLLRDCEWVQSIPETVESGWFWRGERCRGRGASDHNCRFSRFLSSDGDFSLIFTTINDYIAMLCLWLLPHDTGNSKQKIRRKWKWSQLHGSQWKNYIGERLRMQQCHWLRYPAISLKVANHGNERSRGSQPGSLTGPTCVSPLFRVSIPLCHVTH